MRRSKTLCWSVLVFFVSLGVLLTAQAKPAYAGKKIWEDGGSSLTLFGDARFRYELDNDERSGKDDRDRTRERIRLRFGGKFVANENVSMGFRLRSGSNSTQSPHQTLGYYGKSGTNESFGVDRAFVKVKSGGAYLWAGKNGLPLWNPAEFLWDSDAQPEGVALGYGGNVGGAKVKLVLAHFIISEGNWDDDDSLVAYQAFVSTGGDWQVKAAVGGLSFDYGNKDNSDKTNGLLNGGSNTIWHALAEVSNKNLPFQPRLGFGYASSDADKEDIGVGEEEDDTKGWVVYLRGKVSKVDVRVYYWDNGYAAQPLFGALGQDNFPFSSNFEGWHFQVGYKFFEALSADLRYYIQKTKNENLSVFDNNIAMQGDQDRSRVQLNLNVKF